MLHKIIKTPSSKEETPYCNQHVIVPCGIWILGFLYQNFNQFFSTYVFIDENDELEKNYLNIHKQNHIHVMVPYIIRVPSQAAAI